jgi:hypothetical protein
MLSAREQAIEFINTIPEDKIVYVMDMFRGMKGLMESDLKNDKKLQQSLLEEIKELRGIVRSDIDEKTDDHMTDYS